MCLTLKSADFFVTFSLFVILLALLYWYSVYPFSILSRCGIKHPKPVPFFGNMLMFREGFLEPLNDIIKTHGKICGYYLGRRPVVVIADPDMVGQVLVKNFSYFPNRMRLVAPKPLEDSLVLLRDQQWRRVRSILTPSFSAAKMKEMVPLINAATDALMNNLNVHAESGEAFNIHKCFRSFLMDLIASVALGTQLDSQNNPVLLQARAIILFPTITNSFARLIPNKKRVQICKFFISSIKKIIRQREEQPPDQRRRDFLQLMLEALAEPDCAALEDFDLTKMQKKFDKRSQLIQSYKQEDNHPNQEESAAGHPQRKTLTEDEIVGQVFVFLLAGYETSSSTLAFTCYLLALHPECQRKVQEEMDEFFTKHDSLNYSNIQELRYLDMVVFEALRVFTPGFRFDRQVEHDCVVNGQFFPKGAILEILTSSLHSNPEYWSEPEKFIPERFTPEAKANRNPFVYLPFGAGPRSCVGIKLALLEIRMVLAHLSHRFNIVACSETKVPLDLKSFGTLRPKNGVFVKITRRI